MNCNTTHYRANSSSVPGDPTGNPWVLRADAIGPDDELDQKLLAGGYAIVIPPLTAQSGAVRQQWDDVYQLMTSHGFDKKPVLEGTGAGAGEVYAWAGENTDKVTCIVAHNPVMRSLMSKTSPMESLALLANAKVPLLHLCDKNSPWFSEHEAVAKRYEYLHQTVELTLLDPEAAPERNRTAIATLSLRIIGTLIGR